MKNKDSQQPVIGIIFETTVLIPSLLSFTQTACPDYAIMIHYS